MNEPSCSEKIVHSSAARLILAAWYLLTPFAEHVRAFAHQPPAAFPNFSPDHLRRTKVTSSMQYYAIATATIGS